MTASKRKPPLPEKWADLLDPRVDYPDDLVEPGTKRRARRRAKKEYHREVTEARKKWAAEQQRQNPVQPGAVLFVGGLLAIVMLVAGVVVPRLTKSDDTAGEAAATVTTTAPATSAATGGAESVDTITPGDVAPVPAPTTAADVEATLEAWAGEYFDRHPGDDETLEDVLDRARAHMTRPLYWSLVDAGDPTYDYLAEVGAGTVLAGLDIQTPPEGTAPVDTAIRATRILEVTTTYEGGPEDGYTWTTPMRVELANVDGQWLVAAITGGAGQ